MRKVLVLVLIAVLIMGLASGCSLAKKAKDVRDQVDEISGILDELEQISDNMGEDEVLFTSELYAFESYTDVLDTLEAFAFDWVSADGSDDWSFGYETLGEEEIDGVNTRHILVIKTEKGETDEYEIWCNDAWETVKAVVDGEEKEGWDAAGYGTVLTALTQLYVNYQALAGMVYSEPGVMDGASYSLEGKGSESVNVGSGSADVFYLKSNFLDATWTIGLTKVGAKSMYVILEQGAGDSSGGLHVTEAVAR